MTREQRISRLIEDVYEVATDPSQWPCFLVSMQDFFKAENIVMGLINQSEHRNSLSLDYAVDFDPEFKESYDNYYCHKNVQARRAIQQGAMKKGNVLNTEDFFSIEEWMRTEIFNDWGRPQNVFSVTRRFSLWTSAHSACSRLRAARRQAGCPRMSCGLSGG